jgi:DNA-binding transcriptional LysR family regulator
MKQNFTARQGALDGVEAFLGVARHRSFRKAADELGVTPSAISQAVRALEARIGAALFIRTTRSVGLTEAGGRFLSRAKPALEELIAASADARDLGQRPAGLLRLAAPRAVLPHLLDLIASFSRAYPAVEVEIAASADLVDIAREGYDAGIRLGQFVEADMIAVRLTRSFPMAVVGSRDYLRRRPRPERIDDLRHHACLRVRRSNGSIVPWSFVNGNEAIDVIVSGPFIANDIPTTLAAAVAGLGLAQVPEPLAAGALKAGKLESVLERFAPTAPGVFLYYPGNRQMMPKLRAFIDHVKGRSSAAAAPNQRRPDSAARRQRKRTQPSR